MSNINHSLYVYIPSIYCDKTRTNSSMYISGGVCRSKAMLLNKTVINTGANAGIGRERQLSVDLVKHQAINLEKGIFMLKIEEMYMAMLI